MNQPQKTPGRLDAVLDDLKSGILSLLERLFEPVFILLRNRHKFRTGAANNIEIGRMQLAKGRIFDAVFRFRLACWMDNKNAEAAGLLAKAYLAGGRLKEAEKAAKRARELAPANADAADVLRQLPRQ